MKITTFYVGTSLLGPLKRAEAEINRLHDLDLEIAAHNFGAPVTDDQWQRIDNDLSTSEIVFVIHVMDGENALRLVERLKNNKSQFAAVIVINCMPDLMRCTRMGQLNVARLATLKDRKAIKMFSTAGLWMGRQARRRKNGKSGKHQDYLKLAKKMPELLKYVPSAGGLRDLKNYLNVFSYFLQPTPANIRSMILLTIKEYAHEGRVRNSVLDVTPVEHTPSLAIYHPEATQLFEYFEDYEEWHAGRGSLEPQKTIGLLLMRPHVLSGTTKHYDELIRAIEREGLSVIPALATLMDNRDAVRKFFVAESEPRRARVSQIVSLTGFSFVGGPAMNDSDAASEFLGSLNVPYRSAVSLDMQTIDSWKESFTGLNPVQAGMQIAIPEIDGATEPFIFGGLPGNGVEPIGLEERCRMFARRLKNWNYLRTASRSDVKLALTIFCFPPNKGNIGTAADLDVFPSLWDILRALKSDGYEVILPESPDQLRQMLLGGNAEEFQSTTNIAYRMPTSEYRRLCPFVAEVESEWGEAPGTINVRNEELIIQGLQLGNIFIGVQPTFGYEGDPMRLMMARSGGPHHGFMAFYTYIKRVFEADAVIHVGTHGALEFMPGKQVGMSAECWPDRLIGELPNIYIYSINNPSEGSIAKRRSYAELISYLTPPIENAGLYKELNALKDLVLSYRESTTEAEREQLYASIDVCSRSVNFERGISSGASYK